MIVIDPLSVATQGYFETPNSPTLEANRDALRIGTLGWIIVDFGLIPDVYQQTDVEFSNPTDSSISNPFQTFVCEDGSAYANVKDVSATLSVGESVTFPVLSQTETSFVLEKQTASPLSSSLDSASISGTQNSASTKPDATTSPTPDSTKVVGDNHD